MWRVFVSYHVPVWQDIQVFCEERIMSVAEDMPWMRLFHIWEEVIGVSVCRMLAVRLMA